MQTSGEKLPSGKTILRRYADNGSLLEETHSYGLLEIGIQMDFAAGIKTGELYFRKHRMVGRRSYEKARPLTRTSPLLILPLKMSALH
jgi:hypothetical protein